MESHKLGLKIAADDLKSAKILLKEDLTMTAVLHTQQCFKKALKAYLAFQKHPLDRTHDLIILIKLCSNHDREFEVFLDFAKMLKPYATKGRYADDYIELEAGLVIDFIKKAAKVLAFVTKKIENPDPNLKLF